MKCERNAPSRLQCIEATDEYTDTDTDADAVWGNCVKFNCYLQYYTSQKGRESDRLCTTANYAIT